MSFGIANKSGLSEEEIEVRIANYLLQNPAPNDLAFHSFAAGIGVDKDTVEEIAYRMLSTVLITVQGWGLLDRDPKEVETMLYMANCDTEGLTQDILSVSPQASVNMIDLMLRARFKAHIDRQTMERRRVLSYAEEQELEGDLHRKRHDRVAINDQARINVVNKELKRLGLSQGEVDTAMRLLDLDKYSDESALLNSSYSSMREALIASTEYVFDDPLFSELKKEFRGLPIDDRQYGASIRVYHARQSARIMRDIASKYGVSNRGMFSGLGNG